MNTGDLALANTSGSNIGFNSLMTRLDAIREKHRGKDGQNSTANTTFATAFNTSVAKVGNAIDDANVQSVKTALTTLAQSEWLNNTFASKITIPAAGSLIKAIDFNTWDNVITEVDAICPNYSHYDKYGQYGHSYDDYSHSYGDYSKSYGDYSKYDHNAFGSGYA